jgi:hypothetical protein
VKVTLAIPATSIPCTENNTIWARRHVTTDPDDRRTIRNSRFASSLETARTRKPSRDNAPPILQRYVALRVEVGSGAN